MNIEHFIRVAITTYFRELKRYEKEKENEQKTNVQKDSVKD